MERVKILLPMGEAKASADFRANGGVSMVKVAEKHDRPAVGGTDIVSAEVRSRIMRSVGQKDTSAELAVRKILHALGARYRTNNRSLPGSPDIANCSRSWAVFVHGCFWHGHRNCPKTKGGRAGRIPRKNRDYWTEKISANRERDQRKARELRKLGFRVLTVWECELRKPERLSFKLGRFLEKV